MILITDSTKNKGVINYPGINLKFIVKLLTVLAIFTNGRPHEAPEVGIIMWPSSGFCSFVVCMVIANDC